jgi:hypothetical protein
MNKKEKDINLYTARGLVQYLQQNYKVKKTGKEFTNSDVEQYIRYGFIPKLYGGNCIEVVKSSINGCKVYKLTGNHFVK